MGGSKPKPMQAPFQQQQNQTNTYGSYSIADTPEAQQYLNAPLDFGKPVNVDPGVGRRTALAEQGINNRYDSGFMSGIPAWLRDINRNKELREAQGQGAYEDQQAQYLNQQANNQLTQQKTLANMARLERLLPQILQTGGSGTASGYNTQILPGQPGFGSSFLRSFGSSLGNTLGGGFL